MLREDAHTWQSPVPSILKSISVQFSHIAARYNNAKLLYIQETIKLIYNSTFSIISKLEFQEFSAFDAVIVRVPAPAALTVAKTSLCHWLIETLLSAGFSGIPDGIPGIPGIPAGIPGIACDRSQWIHGIVDKKLAFSRYQLQVVILI